MLRCSFRAAGPCLRKRRIFRADFNSSLDTSNPMFIRFVDVGQVAPPVSLQARSTTSDAANSSMVRQMLRAAEEDPAVADELTLMISKNHEIKDKIAVLLEALKGQEPAEPESTQLRKVALAAALPYFGFGLLDNVIMISIGDVLDTTLCVSLGLSTMAAAALGNTVSDVFGVFSGGVVEDVAKKCGFEAPPLSRAQEEMPITRNWERAGQVVGIAVGCIVGMFPLLFIDPFAAEKRKRDKQMDDLYKSVMENCAAILEAEFAQLLFAEQQSKKLYRRSSMRSIRNSGQASEPSSSMPSLDGSPPHTTRVRQGSVAQKAFNTGKYFNIADIRNSEHYNPALHDSYQNTGVPVRSILCMPIFCFDEVDGTSKPVGVLQVINKQGTAEFSSKDENVVAALASHISTFLGASQGNDKGFRHILSLCERSLNTQGVRINAAEDMRAQRFREEVMQDITEMIDAEATFLMVHDEHTDDLSMKVSDKVPFFRSAPHKGVMGKVFDHGRTILVNDLRDSPYYDPDRHDNYRGCGYSAKAILAVPCISTDGSVLGVVESVKSKQVEFQQKDVALLESAAAALAINLEGSGASLRRILKEMHKLHTTGRTSEATDCSAEVASIIESTAKIVKKAGGRVDSVLEWHYQQLKSQHSEPEASSVSQ